MTQRKYTYLGLMIAYGSITLLSQLFNSQFPLPLTDVSVICRELLILGMVGVLFWIITKKENLPLSSIGLGTKNWKETSLWTIITFVLCIGGIFAALEIVKALGMTYGDSKTFSALSKGTITLVCLRAGIAEEVFFRGFIYERLHAMTQSKTLAVALSLIPFAILHFPQGLAGIIIAFVAGGVLTATYLWKRNLTANIIAHFLIDFIGNIFS